MGVGLLLMRPPRGIDETTFTNVMAFGLDEQTHSSLVHCGHHGTGEDPARVSTTV